MLQISERLSQSPAHSRREPFITTDNSLSRPGCFWAQKNELVWELASLTFTMRLLGPPTMLPEGRQPQPCPHPTVNPQTKVRKGSIACASSIA